MARLKTNILDGGFGKVGTVVLYEWRGISCMRSLPRDYKDKKSKAQLQQRQKMKLVHSFLYNFKPNLNLMFNEGSIGRTPYQAAVSYNLKYGVMGDYPDQKINYRSALIAKGTLPLPDSMELIVTGDDVKIEWDTSYFHNSKNVNDELNIYMLGKEIGSYAKRYNTKIKRKEGSCIINEWLTEKLGDLIIWAFFVNKGQTEVSNSVCLAY
ncbi:DUF6266 family protein [Plebeiibacterium sediminum]|uniref:DUF6266 family protein n=1 Tax=Plebeiibacterium sediminum TaxID=2992112 RepID=A0AAE3MAA6_9BACT|nr:DUF6266 family protein [Plebeiobacterium sediminum]MCW3789729.1 DUF6266 family protein [Plebeiobacterium sediminum]